MEVRVRLDRVGEVKETISKAGLFSSALAIEELGHFAIHRPNLSRDFKQTLTRNKDNEMREEKKKEGRNEGHGDVDEPRGSAGISLEAPPQEKNSI